MCKEKQLTKGRLAIHLSKLKVFEFADHNKEQYPTDSEIAATVLWHALGLGDVEGKSFTDLGCGTGVLGIGTLILGAKSCKFVDLDGDALAIAEEQSPPGGNFVNGDVLEYEGTSDVVIMNPPFGTREKHIDAKFLKKSFSVADIIYSFHKTTTVEHLRELGNKNGYVMTHQWNFDFPLKQTQKFHKKRIHRIEVSCLRFEKND